MRSLAWFVRLGAGIAVVAAVRELAFRRNAKRDPLIDKGRAP